MARRAKELTCEIFLKDDDGNITPWDSLTEEEREAWRQRTIERLSRTMSAYYSQHLEDFERLQM